ncbi:hypothetical protein [Streptomyces sp. Ac-502]|uniref:hypothetical protein n=1 Tax=Streptomyces sp. Ac-502 TaxID=3342801 RepID=UPI0038624942
MGFARSTMAGGASAGEWLDVISATTVALMVGVIGVAGTLFSALLTQRAADRMKRQELEASSRLRSEERAVQEMRAIWNMRREIYVALNTAARQYVAALKDMTHAMLLSRGEDEARERLDAARAVHLDHHAEAQLIAPGAVLGVAGSVNREMNQTYGIVKRIDGGNPASEESLEVALARLDEHWELLRVMRHKMRVDLGVSHEGDGD